jgi:LacI family transcriptional regulator
MTRRRVTLADVAHRAGLSKTTASMVLNGREDVRLSPDAFRRVRAAAEELGYRPNVAARSLRTRKTATIAFVSDIVATTRFAGDMIRGALDAAREHDHVLLIAETQGDETIEQQAIEAMLDRQVDGMIYASMATRQLSVPSGMLGRPVVLLNATNAEPDQLLPSIRPDDRAAGYAVASALLEAGHRDGIMLVGRNEVKERDPRISLAAGARLEGITQAMADHGTALAGEAFCEEWQPEDGYTGMRRLLSGPNPPRAVICLNDRLAFGVYQALAEAGLRVADDVSVVSFDDDALASWLRPGLSTAALPHEQMGRQAVEWLIDPDQATGQHLAPMPLITRASIAAPPRD